MRIRRFLLGKWRGTVTTAPVALSIIYNGYSQTLILAGQGTGTMLYKLNNGSWSYNLPQAINAGTYTVYYKTEENKKYKESESGNITVIIDKVTPTVTAPTAKSLVYNASALNLVNAGSTNWGTIKYSLDNINFGETISTATDVGSYTVYYRVDGDSNINNVASKYIDNINILPKTITNPTITLETDTYTYNGQEKKPSVISVKDGNITIASTEYTVSYTNNINAGTAICVITDKADGNYIVSGTKTYTINKADPSYTAPTAKSGLIYNRVSQTLYNVGSNTTPGTFTYASGTRISVGSLTVSWTFTPTDTTNYNSKLGSFTGSINKCTPVLSASPSIVSGLSYNGNALNLLTGGSVQHSSNDSTSVSGSFSYSQGTNAGNYTSLSWSFTPTDSTNYNSISGSISGTATISKVSGSATVTGQSLTYNRSSLNLISVSGNTGTMHYRVDNGSWSTSIPTSTNAGSWTIYWYMDESTNYNGLHSSSNPSSVSASIAKVTPVLSTNPTQTSDWTYDGASHVLASGGAMKHSASDSTAVGGTFTYNSATNAGSYSATWSFTPTDSTNYNYTSGTIGTVTVSKATGATGTSGCSLTYSRGALNLVSVSGNTGTNHYRVGNSAWSTSIPTATNAGTYTIYVYTDEGTNYNGVSSSSSPSSYTTTIAKATPVTSTAPSKVSDWTYNGVTYSLASGGAMKHSSGDATVVDGSFSYASAVNAGSYNATWTFTPTDTTNYNSASGNAGTVTVSKATGSSGVSANTNLTYSGSALNLISVRGATGTNYYKIDSGSWSTTIPSATNAGSYTIYYYTESGTNYNAVSSLSNPSYCSVTIAKADPSITTTPYNALRTYNKYSLTLLAGGVADIAGSWSYDSATNAGTYTANWTFTPTDSTNYNSATGLVSATIAKATGHVTQEPVPIAYITTTGTITGPITLLSDPGIGTGTLEYRINGGSWSTDVPVGAGLSVYYIDYRVLESTNYTAEECGTVVAEISFACVEANEVVDVCGSNGHTSVMSAKAGTYTGVLWFKVGYEAFTSVSSITCDGSIITSATLGNTTITGWKFITLTATENNSYSARYGTVTITMNTSVSGETCSYLILVKQNGY